jgi:hypothetical protein
VHFHPKAEELTCLSDDSIDLMEKMITGFTEQFKHTNETSTNILTLLADSLTALDKALRMLVCLYMFYAILNDLTGTKKQKILIGLMSLLADIVEHRYDLQSVNSAAILLCTLRKCEELLSLSLVLSARYNRCRE